MAKVPPFHSTHPAARVHHNNDKCVDGNNIEARYLKQGTGGHPLCNRCKDLS